MKIKTIDIKNFRLLQNVEGLAFDKNVTLIVGRNNSGKTSLIDIFNKFVGKERSRFHFEDFSISSHQLFIQVQEHWDSLKILKAKGEEPEIAEKEEEMRQAIPSISATIHIEYSEDDNLSVLAPFIMDLDPARNDVCISFEYTPTDTSKLLLAFDESGEESLLEFIKNQHQHYYSEKIFAVDSKAPQNKRLIEKKIHVNDLLLPSFIYAQRHIDDHDLESNKKLSRGFEEYYNDHYKDEEKNASLQSLLNETGIKWDEQYKIIFSMLLNDLKTFGYPGLNSHELAVKAQFEADKVLKGNINIFYKHSEDKLLPESLNGLGFKNLIYIILQFITFYEKYKKQEPTPGLHLLFIEEPEAHLHPQMQNTFIKNIKDFINSKTGWNIQVIITTHSSHIVAESSFSPIRYFSNSNSNVTAKTLEAFETSDPNTKEFLHQYMSLHRCDMFFADKVVLIEGTVERLLLPKMIKKIDDLYQKNLSNQYISIIEVGGAYAHKFKEILNFIEVKTLIITDIDSVKLNTEKEKKRYIKCPVSDGEKTSNSALKCWIPCKEQIRDLLTCSDIDKLQGLIRVAYQVPECIGGGCGRSFEEAFILKNSSTLAKNNNLTATKDHFINKTPTEILDAAYEIAKKIGDHKTDFAFDLMMIDGWDVPKYITDGLLWLEE